MASGNIRIMNAGESISQTQVIQQDEVDQVAPVLKLRLKRPKNSKKVVWSEETVDNENMGKKKSKCCCIYKKPTVFGESSSESENECEHCFGHPEVKNKNKKKCSKNHESNTENNHDAEDNSIKSNLPNQGASSSQI